MHRKPHVYRHIAVPFTFALLLLLLFVPSTFAASVQHGHSAKLRAILLGAKKHYLAIGDSLAFGFQPDLNFNQGYVDDYLSNLKSHGVKDVANMACPEETSVTLLNGNCPAPYLRKFPYIGSQLNAALDYLKFYAGQVSPVTLDIGANDVKSDINTSNCVINQAQFTKDLATLDYNLAQVILPQLHAALMVNGKVTGDLLVMNLYDSYQNICPNSVAFTQTVNQHLAKDVGRYGTIVDVFGAFGGSTIPNPHTCSYTWMCSIFTDIHATTKGYSVIAHTFEQDAGY